MANVGVIGAGSWGTALSVLLADNGHHVTIWSIDEKEVEMLDKKPLNKYGRVGLGVYASKIFFRDFKVYKPFVKKFETSYEELRKQD